ncbi:MAG: tetraacyldisaccharide 4'-kinase [Fimbriimonadales bacterium]|nr:tetraacyldisaccharide 4'-kinase [Fimbriimonadales bacterium]
MKAVAQRLETVWQERPPLWLRGAARLYALGWHTYAGVYRLGLRRRVALPVPIIGVGSLWAGGVGKTPLAIAIARLLHQAGRQVAVLVHGYGGRRYRQVTLIEPSEYPDPAQVGDEAAEVRMALPDVPIAVGKWRVRTARAALMRWSPEALVLDDGFQHLPLARTLDLVALPAESPLGNGYCLPAGPLREPPSGLNRADGIVFVSHCSAGVPCEQEQIDFPAHATYTATIAPAALLHLSTRAQLPLSALQGRPMTLVCGIARPERFVRVAQGLGYTITRVCAYPDHYRYNADELYPLASETVLTTAKDAVKLCQYLPAGCDAYALLLEARLCQALQTRLLSLFTGTVALHREY